MKYIQGNNRKQIVLYNSMLDDIIEKDNEVRRIDEFVDSLNLASLGFKNMNIAEEGRPGYHPADLLKLYIYGYMNRTRSSRELEKESKRNIEVMWLIKELKPDHNTISNFRRDNADAIRNVFQCTVTIAKNHDLIGGRIIAGDSVKLRAQNSKKIIIMQIKLPDI
jgi:transposase